MTVKLQVALDLQQGDRAIQIAREAIKGGADWIEAGTPLIKSEGLEIVRKLKEECQGKMIVADLKTMDVGALEADMAARQGADIIVVMGVASDSTIAEAVVTAEKYGTKVMVDMMAVIDPIVRSQEVAALGASYICVHVPVDEQMKGISASSLANIIPDLPLEVAIAGGITDEKAAELVALGAKIIIVGGAITKAADATSATKAIKRAMERGVAEGEKISGKYKREDLAQIFSRVSTPNISDAQHRQGVMKGILPRNRERMKMVGRALTVQTANGDWAKSVEVVEIANPGDVIVVDAGGGDSAVWGELASCSAKNKGVAGVVVDGAIRDLEEIDKLQFPCFARHVVPDAGEPKGFGGIDVQITCGGVRVRTGDWIIGDGDGVVVVPAEKGLEVANRALDVLERENRIREEIRRGSTLSEVLELKKWEKA